MAMNYKPQNGDVKTAGPTLYPYEYEAHVLTIKNVSYAVENNGTPEGEGARVFCIMELSNDVLITGSHEQYEKKNADYFKQLAYANAIERAESFGYKLSI